MIISIIVAHGKNLEIGKDNQLLWKLSSDLKRFKNLTMGHCLILGRKTYESIGRLLPGRKMIVISRHEHQNAEGLYYASSLENAIDISRNMGESEVFIAGGGEIYKLGLEKADKLYISEVDYEGEADTFFPTYDLSKWKVIKEESFFKTEKDQYPFNYRELVRI